MNLKESVYTSEFDCTRTEIDKLNKVSTEMKLGQFSKTVDVLQ